MRKTREPTAAKVGEIADALNVDMNFLYQDEVKERKENNVSLEELSMVKKYRDLDHHGKKMVDFTLNEEWKRSTAGQKKETKVIPMMSKDDPNYVNAAHAIEGASEEDKQHDEDIMNDENF